MPVYALVSWPVPPCAGERMPVKEEEGTEMLAPKEVVATTLPEESVERSAEVRPVNQVVPELVKPVVDALPLNCWSAVQVFWCARFNPQSETAAEPS
jgi:hypothetical protein